MAAILVTGAGGFIGGHVARRLAKLFSVRAMVRGSGAETLAGLRHPNITLVPGDLQDAASLIAATDEVDGIVHCATDTVMADALLARDVAVEGTRRLYHAAKHARVGRFVYISSLSVYGGAATMDETVLPQPCGDLYADLKIAAEQQVPNLPPFGPVRVILRPPAVFGPRSGQWTVGIAKAARQGQLYLPAGGHFAFPYIYIDNLVDAVVRALKAGTLGGVFNVADGVMSYAQYVAPYARRAGVVPRSVPYAAAWAGRAAGELRASMMGRCTPLTRQNLRLVTHMPGAVSCERAREELGWEPRIAFAEAMATTLAWLDTYNY